MPNQEEGLNQKGSIVTLPRESPPGHGKGGPSHLPTCAGCPNHPGSRSPSLSPPRPYMFDPSGHCLMFHHFLLSYSFPSLGCGLQRTGEVSGTFTAGHSEHGVPPKPRWGVAPRRSLGMDGTNDSGQNLTISTAWPGPHQHTTGPVP